MKHPALTRVLAAALAVMCVITLLSGGICLSKAATSRAEQKTATDRLESNTTEAKALWAELEGERAQYNRTDNKREITDAALHRYGNEYRKDLATFTATEAGIKLGKTGLYQGEAAMKKAWEQYHTGAEAFAEAEAQFNEGYEQFLAGKAELERGLQQLGLAEAYVNSGADIALQKSLIAAGADLSARLLGSTDALRSALGELQSDSGEDLELRAQILETVQSNAAALLQQLGESESLKTAADEAVKSAQRFYEANEESLNTLLDGGFSAEEVQALLGEQAAKYAAQLEAMKAMAGELDTGAADTETLKAQLETLRAQGEALLDPAQSDEQLLRNLLAALGTERDLLSTVNTALNGAASAFSMLENLDTLKAQMETAKAAMDENEPALLEAKAQMDEMKAQMELAKAALEAGQQQMDQGKAALYGQEKKLDETREALGARKEKIEQTEASLDEMGAAVDAFAQREEHYNNLRYAILANDNLSAKVESEEALFAAAEGEIARERSATAREFALRSGSAAAVLLCAVLGLAAVAAAYAQREPVRLLCVLSALCFLAAAASEAMSYAAGRGMLYTSLAVALFALPMALLNLKKA